jgi:mono/diheme cytochrome c family protein
MRILARLVFLAIACALVAWAIVARANLPAAERGRRIAERWGCFTCHGPGGLKPVPNHGRLDKVVPDFSGDVMMYAKSDDDLRDWIHDGVNKRKSVSQTWREQRDKGALRMPAFGRVLSKGQIDDLVAYVDAMAGEPEPRDSLPSAGFDRAKALGCFGCHGPGGRLAARNPGSLKGYVPSWDGRDWPELVQDRREFEQWVNTGVSERFKQNPLAMYLLKRAALRMPAFRSHLDPGDMEALWAYVQWLRSTPH